MDWNSEDVKYRCCCKRLHVKTGLLIVGILVLIGATGGVVAQSVNVALWAENTGGFALGFAVCAIAWDTILACSAIALLFAYRSQCPQLCLPFLVFQALSICFTVALGVVCLVMLLANGSVFGYYPEKEGEGNVPFALMIVFGAAGGAAVQSIFFWIVYKGFAFFKDQAKEGNGLRHH